VLGWGARRHLRRDAIGVLLGGAVRRADRGLALHARTLLRDVRQLVRHQLGIVLALAGAEEHVVAVRDAACPARSHPRAPS